MIAPRVVTTLTALGLLGCGGTVVFEASSGSGGAGDAGGLASATSVTATAGPTVSATTGGSVSTGGEGGGGGALATGSGGAGGGDPLAAACMRFCQVHGEPCSTFEGDCVRDCTSVAETFGCEPEWIEVIGCIARSDVTCEDVEVCAESIDRWNACIEA